MIAMAAVSAIVLDGVGGGLFYTLGALAPDFKTVGGYDEETLNQVLGAMYTGVSALQLPVSLIARVHPAATLGVSQCCVVVGWALLAAAVWCSWSPAALGVVVAALGMAIASVCMPLLQLASADITAHSPRLWAAMNTTLYAAYAAGGLIAALVYLAPISNIRDKLAGFIAAFAVVNVLGSVATLQYLRSRRPVVVAPAAAVADERVPLMDGDYEPSGGAMAAPAPPTGRQGSWVARLIVWPVAGVVTSPPFWLCCSMLTAMFATTVNLYNNAGIMAATLEAEQPLPQVLFVEFCVGQLVTRVAASWWMFPNGGQLHVRRALIAAGLVLAAGVLIGTVAHLRLNAAVLYVITFVNALGYGCLWVLVFGFRAPGVLVEPHRARTFGTDEYVVYGALSLAPAVGPILADKLSGYLYDRVADPATHGCTGPACYGT